MRKKDKIVKGMGKEKKSMAKNETIWKVFKRGGMEGGGGMREECPAR